jgi:hypothetical protein
MQILQRLYLQGFTLSVDSTTGDLVQLVRTLPFSCALSRRSPHRSSAIPGDSEPFSFLTTDDRNLVLTQATVDETTMPIFVCWFV